MVYKQCGSESQNEFGADISIHNPQSNGPPRADFEVFATLVVCLGCGFAECKVSRDDLPLLVHIPNGPEDSVKIRPISTLPSKQNWRQLYRVVLFESDKQKLPARLAEAEKALARRTRELFKMSGEGSDEWQALDKALYALRALRDCLELKKSKAKAA